MINADVEQQDVRRGGGRRTGGCGAIGRDDRRIRRQGVGHAGHSSVVSGKGDVLGPMFAEAKRGTPRAFGGPKRERPPRGAAFPLTDNRRPITAASRRPQARISWLVGILVTAADDRG